MSRADLDVATDGTRVRVEGLRTTLRAMQKAGAATEDMKELMHSIGTLVVQAATPPVLTGRLSTTLRAGRGKTKAVVRAGGARAPYAGVVHYGWPARNIPANPFLTEALQRTRPAILQALDKGLADLLREQDLT